MFVSKLQNEKVRNYPFLDYLKEIHTIYFIDLLMDKLILNEPNHLYNSYFMPRKNLIDLNLCIMILICPSYRMIEEINSHIAGCKVRFSSRKFDIPKLVIRLIRTLKAVLYLIEWLP